MPRSELSEEQTPGGNPLERIHLSFVAACMLMLFRVMLLAKRTSINIFYLFIFFNFIQLFLALSYSLP